MRVRGRDGSAGPGGLADDGADLEPLPVDGHSPFTHRHPAQADPPPWEPRPARFLGMVDQHPHSPPTAADDAPDAPAGARTSPTLSPRLLAGLAIATAALVVAAMALVLISPRRPGSDAAASARRFLAGRLTARFVDEATSRYVSLTHQVRSSDTGRWRSEGELRLPSMGRLTTTDGRGAREHLVLGDERFTRQASSREELRSTAWVRSPSGPAAEWGWTAIPDARFGRGQQPDLAAPDPASIPFNLPAVVGALAKAKRGDRQTITVSLGLYDLVPQGARSRLAPDAQSARGTITLTAKVAGDGRIERLDATRVLNLGGDQETERHRFTFTDWDSAVALSPPNSREVDATPTIDEHALRQVSDLTVLSPSPMPDPWRLVSVDVVAADAAAEECQSVTLTYLSRTIVVANYLGTDADPPTFSITSVPAACPWLDAIHPDLARFRARPAFAGQLPIHIIDSPDANTYSYLSSGWTAVATSGNTYVLATTNWADAELLRLLARLSPLDLAGQRLADDDLMRLAG